MLLTTSLLLLLLHRPLLNVDNVGTHLLTRLLLLLQNLLIWTAWTRTTNDNLLLLLLFLLLLLLLLLQLHVLDALLLGHRLHRLTATRLKLAAATASRRSDDLLLVGALVDDDDVLRLTGTGLVGARRSLQNLLLHDALDNLWLLLLLRLLLLHLTLVVLTLNRTCHRWSSGFLHLLLLLLKNLLLLLLSLLTLGTLGLLTHNQLLGDGLVVGRNRRMDDGLLDDFWLLAGSSLQLLNVLLLNHLSARLTRLRESTLNHHLLMLLLRRRRLTLLQLLWSRQNLLLQLLTT